MSSKRARDRRGLGTDCRRAACRWRRSAVPRLRLRHRPTPSKFSSANPIGSIRAWHDGADGIGCGAPASARASTARLPCGAAFRIAEYWAAAAAAERRAGCRASTSRAAPRDVRFGYDVTVRMLPCPSRPRRLASASGHPPELRPVDVRRCRSARQSLVQERVVGVEQVERRCDPRGRCCRRTASSPA